MSRIPPMPKSCRECAHKPSPAITRIEDALAAMIEPDLGFATVGVKQAARRLHVATSTCYQYIEGRRPFPAALVPDVTELTGLTFLIDFLNRECGMVGVPMAAGHLTPISIPRIVREFSEFLSSVADGLADGTLDAKEAEHIERDGYAAIGAILEAIGRAKATAATAHVVADRATTLKMAERG